MGYLLVGKGPYLAQEVRNKIQIGELSTHRQEMKLSLEKYIKQERSEGH